MENFGYYSFQGDFEPGILGEDMRSIFLLNLKKNNLWSIDRYIYAYSEDDLFDMIEFLYDHVSKPIEDSDSSIVFDKYNGQEEFRVEINRILKDYQTGYELSKEGQIYRLIHVGFENIFNAGIPTKNVSDKEKIDHAISKFRCCKSSLNDRKDAIRELVDILERLRPEFRKILTRQCRFI